MHTATLIQVGAVLVLESGLVTGVLKGHARGASATGCCFCALTYSVRLARPDSPWARIFYGAKRRARAAAKYGHADDMPTLERGFLMSSAAVTLVFVAALLLNP